jgi:hypothetical protein
MQTHSFPIDGGRYSMAAEMYPPGANLSAMEENKTPSTPSSPSARQSMRSGGLVGTFINDLSTAYVSSVDKMESSHIFKDQDNTVPHQQDMIIPDSFHNPIFKASNSMEEHIRHLLDELHKKDQMIEDLKKHSKVGGTQSVRFHNMGTGTALLINVKTNLRKLVYQYHLFHLLRRMKLDHGDGPLLR